MDNGLRTEGKRENEMDEWDGGREREGSCRLMDRVYLGRINACVYRSCLKNIKFGVRNHVDNIAL